VNVDEDGIMRLYVLDTGHGSDQEDLDSRRITYALRLPEKQYDDAASYLNQGL